MPRSAALWTSSSRADRAVVLLLVLSLSLGLFFTGQQLELYVASFLLAILALPLAIWHPRFPGRLTIGPTGLVLLALFLWTTAAVVWSSVPYTTQMRAGVIGAVLTHYLVWRLLDPVHRIPRLAVVVALATGSVVATVMLLQITLGLRPTAAFLNPNTAAGFVNLLWPVAAVLALAGALAPAHRVLLLSMVAGMVYALSFDGSRAALFALLAALAVLLLASGQIAPRKRRGALAVAVLGAVLAAHASHAILNPDRSGAGAQLAALSNPASAGAGRLRIWQATGEMISERPWLGFGPGTFFHAYPSWRPPGDDTAAFQVHNDYLQYWVEGGLPALVLVVAVFAVTGGLFLHGMRHGGGVEGPALARLAVAAALAGAAIHALFSYNLQVLPYLLVVGGLLAAFDAAVPEHFQKSVSLPALRQRVFPVAAFIGGLLLSAIQVGTMGLNDYFVHRGVRHINAGQVDAAEEDFKRARQIWDDQDTAWLYPAYLQRKRLENMDHNQTEERQRLQSKALELLAGAIDRNPWRANAHSVRGKILLQPPDRDAMAAEASFHRALELDPRFIDARVALIDRLRARGASDSAWQVLHQGLEIEYSRRNPSPLLRIGIAMANGRGETGLARDLEERLETRSMSPPRRTDRGTPQS